MSRTQSRESMNESVSMDSDSGDEDDSDDLSKLDIPDMPDESGQCLAAKISVIADPSQRTAGLAL